MIRTMSDEQLNQFRLKIWDYYRVHRRSFAWRENPTPYNVFISEIMLQQTQTHRVAPKYEAFIAQFPTFEILACAETRDVLSAWQGLGYNRRGLYLHKSAQKVVNEFQGLLPNDPNILVTFDGIGKATAASMCAFAFNKPTIFIETNIRAVYIHEFFKNNAEVHDNQLLPLIVATVDTQNPREWYYALMDYGVMLKQCHKNPSRKSAHHAKQSKFEGSERQIRGMILRVLLDQKASAFDRLCQLIDREPVRIERNLENLLNEGLIKKQGDFYFL
jgi:A/G-specific adenine glycosylase